MTQERDEAIAKVYEELGPVKTEILQRYTGSDYDKPQFKRRIGQEMGLSKSKLNEALEYAKEHLKVYEDQLKVERALKKKLKAGEISEEEYFKEDNKIWEFHLD